MTNPDSPQSEIRWLIALIASTLLFCLFTAPPVHFR